MLRLFQTTQFSSKTSNSKTMGVSRTLLPKKCAGAKLKNQPYTKLIHEHSAFQEIQVPFASSSDSARRAVTTTVVR